MHRSSVGRIFKVAPHLRGRRVDELTVDDVAVLIAGLAKAGYKRETIRKTLTVLSQTLDFYELDPNVARDERVKLPKERKPHIPPPLAEHVERVAETIPRDLVLPLLVIDECGPRVRELETATVGDLDEHRRAIRVRWTFEKNDRYRHLELPDELFATVVAMLPPREDRDLGAPLFPGLTDARLRMAITRACRATGTPHFSPHGLRRRRAPRQRGKLAVEALGLLEVRHVTDRVVPGRLGSRATSRGGARPSRATPPSPPAPCVTSSGTSRADSTSSMSRSVRLARIRAGTYNRRLRALVELISRVQQHLCRLSRFDLDGSVQLAADCSAGEGGGVVVDVVGARVLAERLSRRAGIGCCRATQFDVAGRGGRTAEERHNDRAGNADRGLVDVTCDEGLVIRIEDLRLEADRSVVPDLDLGVAGRRGRRAGRLVARAELCVQDAHDATVLRRRRTGGYGDDEAGGRETDKQTPHAVHLPSVRVAFSPPATEFCPEQQFLTDLSTVTAGAALKIGPIPDELPTAFVRQRGVWPRHAAGSRNEMSGAAGEPSARSRIGDDVEVAVIGAGQAGLAIGYFLRREGRRLAILERATEIAPAWRERWDSLTLFTPRHYSGLPGLPLPGDPVGYPTRDEVIAYGDGQTTSVRGSSGRRGAPRAA
jgi:NAD(P)-binding Rossmann-like domain